MKNEYKKLIDEVKEYGGILDIMLALQNIDGYLTETAIQTLAEELDMYPSQIYETASFYSMIRLSKPKGQLDIRVCRGAPCHVAGAQEVISAIEKEFHLSIGHASNDGMYYLGYVECLGQCQSAPSLLINGQLYSDLTPEKAVDIIKKINPKGDK